MPIFIQPNLTPVIAALSAQQQALTEEINAQKQTLTSAINAQQQALSAAIESNEQAVAGELLTTKQQLLASAESTAQAVSNKGVIKSIQRGLASGIEALISSVDINKSVVITSNTWMNTFGGGGQVSQTVSKSAKLEYNKIVFSGRGDVEWQVIEYE